MKDNGLGCETNHDREMRALGTVCAALWSICVVLMFIAVVLLNGFDK